MENYVFWFVAAFALVGAELMVGSFYLLVLGVGAAAGGLAALLGIGFGAQVGMAAAVAVLGIVALRKLNIGAALGRGRSNQSLDTGQPVEVLERRPDGSLRVAYRGTQWDAQLEGPFAAGPLYIREMRGSKLIVSAEQA